MSLLRVCPFLFFKEKETTSNSQWMHPGVIEEFLTGLAQVCKGTGVLKLKGVRALGRIWRECRGVASAMGVLNRSKWGRQGRRHPYPCSRSSHKRFTLQRPIVGAGHSLLSDA
jgi:hypothetical protein